MSRGAPRSFRFVVWLGWLIFGAGLLCTIVLYFRHGATTVPKVRWRSRWGQPRWLTFRDPLGQFLIDYPSDWDMSAPFERFTRHRIGELVAVDTVAFRHAHPGGLLVVISYTGPRSFSASEWLKRTRSDGTLKDVFGETILSREPGPLAGVTALKVTAEGLVAEGRYRLESWFVPHGANAFRITGGAPLREFALAAPTLHRIVASFRFAVKSPVP